MENVPEEIRVVYGEIFGHFGEEVTCHPTTGSAWKMRVTRTGNRLDGSGDAGKRLAGQGTVFVAYTADLPQKIACGDKLVDAAGKWFEVVLQDGKSGWEYADPYQFAVKIYTREYRKKES